MKIADQETEQLSTFGPLYITIPVRKPMRDEEEQVYTMSEREKMAIRRALTDRRSTEEHVIDGVVEGLMAAINAPRPTMRLSVDA